MARRQKEHRKHKVSTELSLSCDRNLVVQIPAAENALSASTDVGGTVNKYEYIVSK